MNKLAYVFPGQGSQSVGMLAALAEAYPQVAATFAEASDVLGYDLWQVVQQDENKLNQTQVTQPALLSASVSVWRVLQEVGAVRPDCLAGHSLGEYSALVGAEVLSFADAVSLVEARGVFMQQAVPAGTGAMIAIIGLDDEKIRAACEQSQKDTGEIVSAVNYNSPGQVVIAGTKAAAEQAAELCKTAGAKRAMPLAVSVPSHCALMKPAAEQLAERLSGISFKAPAIPVINNVDVAMADDPDNIRDALVRQLYCPVRWTETVQLLAQHGVAQMYEIGPGKVLTGLTKRIDKSISAGAVNEPGQVQELKG